MKVCIIEVFKKNSTQYVSFSSKFGTGVGEWRGEIPIVNNEYFVEIEIPQVLTWGKEITLNESSSNKIFTSEGSVNFIGNLEMIDENEIAFVRFDKILIDFETDGIAFPVNSFVKVSVQKFILCEINF